MSEHLLCASNVVHKVGSLMQHQLPLWSCLYMQCSLMLHHQYLYCNVQVRVMPRCWYVLLRFFLRVDKVLVKLRETRLFCPFSTDSTVGPVIREIKYSEGTFEELSKAGAPADGVGKFTKRLQGAVFSALQNCHHACSRELSSPGLSCCSHLPCTNAALLTPCLLHGQPAELSLAFGFMWA